MKELGIYTYPTNLGTLRLVWGILPDTKADICEVFLADRNIGRYGDPWIAAQKIGLGDLDHRLGMAAVSLGLPSDLKSWNQLK